MFRKEYRLRELVLRWDVVLERWNILRRRCRCLRLDRLCLPMRGIEHGLHEHQLNLAAQLQALNVDAAKQSTEVKSERATREEALKAKTERRNTLLKRQHAAKEEAIQADFAHKKATLLSSRF